jgi:putative NADH-flavin reductase
MKIAVFGGTGMVGSRVVAEARSRGHEVTALSRRGGDGVQSADAARADQVETIAAGHDVVVSALGPSREAGGDPSAFAGTVLDLAAAVGPTRLVVVGGAGSLLAEPGVRLVDTPGFPPEYRAEALAAADALEALRGLGPDTDWTFLSPAPVIAPGERTGNYAVGGDEPAGSNISAEDYAVALVDEIEEPRHRRARFTVAN